MRRRCSILVLFVLLVFGASVVVPAEDVPETAYDESEALPYESVPLFSIAAAPVTTRSAQAVRGFLDHKLGAPSLFTPAHVRDTAAHRAAGARVLSVLLCTLLC